MRLTKCFPLVFVFVSAGFVTIAAPWVYAQCTAEIEGADIPNASVTWNATLQSTQYTNTWTVLFNCPGGFTSSCASCVSNAAYSSSTGAIGPWTWITYDCLCGDRVACYTSGNVQGYTVTFPTSTALTPGVYYKIAYAVAVYNSLYACEGQDFVVFGGGDVFAAQSGP